MPLLLWFSSHSPEFPRCWTRPRVSWTPIPPYQKLKIYFNVAEKHFTHCLHHIPTVDLSPAADSVRFEWLNLRQRQWWWASKQLNDTHAGASIYQKDTWHESSGVTAVSLSFPPMNKLSLRYHSSECNKFKLVLLKLIQGGWIRTLKESGSKYFNWCLLTCTVWPGVSDTQISAVTWGFSMSSWCSGVLTRVKELATVFLCISVKMIHHRVLIILQSSVGSSSTDLCFSMWHQTWRFKLCLFLTKLLSDKTDILDISAAGLCFFNTHPLQALQPSPPQAWFRATAFGASSLHYHENTTLGLVPGWPHFCCCRIKNWFCQGEGTPTSEVCWTLDKETWRSPCCC